MPLNHNGAEIRRRRRELGIKPLEFARRVDLQVSSLNHIELNSRRPSIEALHRIARELGCTVDDVLISDGVSA